MTYIILLKKEPGGRYSVTVPSLPGCITFGDNIAHALEMAKEAIALYIEAIGASAEDIPDDKDTSVVTIRL